MSVQVIAITGIHTNIGKTICAAVLTQAWRCDYWKPIQAGELQRSDSIVVQDLLSNPSSNIWPEAHRLTTAASPHVAADIDNVQISLESLRAPLCDKLLIETAGGVMSPITEQHTVADYVAFYKLPVILVVQHYLGSISHTLSAIDALQSRDVSIFGLVINGEANAASEKFISNYSNLPIIARVPQLAQLDAMSVAQAAQHITFNPWNI